VDDDRGRLIVGDCRQVLAILPAESVQVVVSSPPYWRLRSYLPDDHPAKHLEIGLEESLSDHVRTIVEVFREVRRVLRKDGTCWINLGDSWVGAPPGNDRPDHSGEEFLPSRGIQCGSRRAARVRRSFRADRAEVVAEQHRRVGKLKPKDLIGLPWEIAFALRDDGWFLRSDVIWHKRNVMPESVGDRPTRAHDYIFMLAKSRFYVFDQGAVAEAVDGTARPRGRGVNPKAKGAPTVPKSMGTRKVDPRREAKDADASGRLGREPGWRAKQNASFSAAVNALVARRNRRSVWSFSSQGYKGAHFATFPRLLPEICIAAGSRPGDVILDPFFGAGTTALAAERLGRRWVGVELSPDYAAMAERRIVEARVEAEARAQRRVEGAGAQRSLIAAGVPLAGFRTIVADPPWSYDDDGARGAAAHHYQTMSIDEICSLRVGQLSATDAHLYLWSTNAHVPTGEAVRVMQAWGFDYKCTITWVKDRIGNGHYFRATTEHVLFGVRGRSPILRHDLASHFEAPRGAHSSKPDVFFEIVEEASPGPYLEIFARGPNREGWWSWGDQATGDVLAPECLGPIRGAGG
jgi:DNA modification methylase/N6-adenosine-specific RNA methylase IME4